MHSTHNFKIRNKNFRIFDNNVNYQKQKRKENYMIINNIPEFLSDHQSCNHTPGVLPKCRRIIAIGDLHGDFQAMQQALIRAKIIDIDNNWIGEDSIVVQVGDVLDGGGRGHEIDSNGNNSLAEIQIFHFLYKLNVAARSSNGRVISLIGNHELMNMLGDFRYVSNSHKSGLGGDVKRKELFKPGGKLDVAWEYKGAAPLRGARAPTAKEIREEGNFKAVGGMRNPALFVNKVPNAASAGREIRQILGRGLDRFPAFTDSVLASLSGSPLSEPP